MDNNLSRCNIFAFPRTWVFKFAGVHGNARCNWVNIYRVCENVASVACNICMTESEDHMGYDEDGKKVGMCKNLFKWQQNLSQGGAYT